MRSERSEVFTVVVAIMCLWILPLFVFAEGSSDDTKAVLVVPKGCIPDKSLEIDLIAPKMSQRVADLAALDDLIDDWVEIDTDKQNRVARIQKKSEISDKVKHLSVKYNLRVGFWNHYLLSKTSIVGTASTGEEESDVNIRDIGPNEERKITIDDQENTSLALKYEAKLADIFDRGAASERAVKDFLSPEKLKYDTRVKNFLAKKNKRKDDFIVLKSKIELACLKTEGCDISPISEITRLKSSAEDLVSIRNLMYKYFSDISFHKNRNRDDIEIGFKTCADSWFDAELKVSGKE